MNTLCLTTYNRSDILQHSLESLMATDFPENTRLLVKDDCSSDPKVKQLLTGLPPTIPVQVQVNQRNLRCDANVMQSIKEGFLISNAPYVFVIDSDGVYHPQWMKQLLALYHKYPDAGAISAFNTDKHKTIHEYDDCVEKHSIGGFAVLVKREVFEGITTTTGWDWRMTEVCQIHGFKMLATKQSYADHIGYIGTHSNLRTIGRCATALNYIGDPTPVQQVRNKLGLR